MTDVSNYEHTSHQVFVIRTLLMFQVFLWAQKGFEQMVISKEGLGVWGHHSEGSALGLLPYPTPQTDMCHDLR